MADLVTFIIGMHVIALKPVFTINKKLACLYSVVNPSNSSICGLIISACSNHDVRHNRDMHGFTLYQLIIIIIVQ